MCRPLFLERKYQIVQILMLFKCSNNVTENGCNRGKPVLTAPLWPFLWVRDIPPFILRHLVKSTFSLPSDQCYREVSLAAVRGRGDCFVPSCVCLGVFHILSSYLSNWVVSTCVSGHAPVWLYYCMENLLWSHLWPNTATQWADVGK